VARQTFRLRAIEYGTFERVGGNESLEVDVRVIAATNADLPALAASGRFRADLLDRLAFDVVALPPLRDRPEDISLLAEHFATRMTAELGREYFPGFTPAAMQRLRAHDWPGNVRELRNVVERSVCRTEHPTQMLDEVILDPFAGLARPPLSAAPASVPPAPLPLSDFAGAVRRFEADLLRRALEEARHNQRRAAALLGLSYDQLRHLLRAHPHLRPTRQRGA
jgi:psp operon transcriptional activator